MRELATSAVAANIASFEAAQGILGSIGGPGDFMEQIQNFNMHVNHKDQLKGDNCKEVLRGIRERMPEAKRRKTQKLLVGYQMEKRWIDLRGRCTSDE